MNRDKKIPIVHMGTICVLLGFFIGTSVVQPLLQYDNLLVFNLARLLIAGHILNALVVGVVVATFYKKNH